MRDGFIKVAAGSPRISVADVESNAASIRDMISRADEKGVNLLVLPELCLTGATCADLFTFETLLDGAEKALVELAKFTEGKYPVVVVGLPKKVQGKLYNCAAVLYDGEILGFVPKKNVTGQRQFAAPASDCALDAFIDGTYYPVHTQMQFCCEDLPDFQFSIEISDDLMAPIPASYALCMDGATIIANPSASFESVGRKDYRRLMAQSTSARLLCGYVTANAGYTESTQDVVYSQHNIICEKGKILAENAPFEENDLIISEIDVKKLASERRKNPGFTVIFSGCGIMASTLSIAVFRCAA